MQSLFIKPTFLLLVLLQTTTCKNIQKDKKNAFYDDLNNNSHITDTIPTELEDLRDGEIYPVIMIGTQLWMAENLRYEIKGAVHNPNNPSRKYGKMYPSHNLKNICPEGWHIPNDNEWKILERNLGLSDEDVNSTGWRGKHGTKLKSTKGWLDQGTGTNSSGFNALPTGHYFEGNFDGLGASAGFCVSPDNNHKTWTRFLAGPYEGINRFEGDTTSNSACACRCIKD